MSAVTALLQLSFTNQARDTKSLLYLTKSRYMAGLQCLRRLWSQVHEPQVWQELSPGLLLDTGAIIGEKARLLFPGGVLVSEPPWQHTEGVERTMALMQDASVPAIFEAAFSYENVRVRVDVLARCPTGWSLLEVKGSSRVKDHYVDDIALQVHVLAGAGLPLSVIEVLHVNTGYVRGSGELDWSAFFTRTDVSARVALQRHKVPGRLPALHDALSLEAVPDVAPTAHCHDPYKCEFWEQCTKDKPP